MRKRRKIVDKFNKRFELNLSDVEIDRIVDASYASIEWEVEIYAMTKEMTTINVVQGRDCFCACLYEGLLCAADIIRFRYAGAYML